MDCYFLERDGVESLLGRAKTIDKEYYVEEEKLDLSFWDVLNRERNRQPDQFRSEASKEMSPWARAKRRSNYRKGNLESKYQLMASRNYGRPDVLDKKGAPTLSDLDETSPPLSETYWSFPFFRVSIVALSYFAFPLFLIVFKNFQTIDPEDFDIVVNQLAPNVGVLYATILALTLQVLYARFTRIQENATTEANLISQVTRNILLLFANDKNDEEWAVESCQIIANQVRILMSRTRGLELLSIMKADTYSNLLAIIDDYHYLHGCDDDFSPQEESIIGHLRGEIGQLMESRALRLSDEASSLPPTHFLLLTSLSVTSTIAYVVASLRVVDDLWHPPQEASLLFAGLLALYILFFNFCRDLNGPFNGVYQIKRSNAASHLLQTKWLIVNSLGDSVDFSADLDEYSSKSPNNVGQVDSNAMQILVDELEQTKGNIMEDEDLCEGGSGLASLDCDDEGRAQALSKVRRLESELARLKSRNEDPQTRLHRLKSELDDLKSLHHQYSNSVPSSMAQSPLQEARAAAIAAERHLSELLSSNNRKAEVFDSLAKPLTEASTGVTFDAKLEDLYLVGVGVRKKAIINVYAASLYGSERVLEMLSGGNTKTSLEQVTQLLDSAKVSFVLEMTFKASGEAIADSIADSLKPRYSGDSVDLQELQLFITEGVGSKGGQATKGTVFRFDCDTSGVSVFVDGTLQGKVIHEGIGSAMASVFLDDKAVSPSLVTSCVGSVWTKPLPPLEHDPELASRIDDARNTLERAQKNVQSLTLSP